MLEKLDTCKKWKLDHLPTLGQDLEIFHRRAQWGGETDAADHSPHSPPRCGCQACPNTVLTRWAWSGIVSLDGMLCGSSRGSSRQEGPLGLPEVSLRGPQGPWRGRGESLHAAPTACSPHWGPLAQKSSPSAFAIRPLIARRQGWSSGPLGHLSLLREFPSSFS